MITQAVNENESSELFFFFKEEGGNEQICSWLIDRMISCCLRWFSQNWISLNSTSEKPALMTCRNSWQMFSVKQGCPLNKLGLPLPPFPRILLKKKKKNAQGISANNFNCGFLENGIMCTCALLLLLWPTNTICLPILSFVFFSIRHLEMLISTVALKLHFCRAAN